MPTIPTSANVAGGELTGNTWIDLLIHDASAIDGNDANSTHDN